jgi:long-chain fatty acid transport protein
MANIGSLQVVQVLQVDMPSIKFNNNGSLPALGQPLGGDGGSAGHTAFIPQLYAVMPLSKALAVGMTVNVPFGLKTQYDNGWMGRFQALTSEVRAFNFNPALSYRVSDQLWLGAGLNIQYLDADLTNAFNYAAVVVQGATANNVPPAQIAAWLNPSSPITIAGLQGSASVTGSDTAMGWNVGAMYNLPNVRLGAQYRSTLRYHIRGNATFNAPTTNNPVAAQIIAAASAPGGPLATTPITSDLNLPASASLGALWQVHPDWEVLFDVQWTGWSSVRDVTFVRPDGSVLGGNTYNWRDTWRLSAGANYSLRDWKLRAGIAWDQTVVTDDVYRDARLPDADRLWLALGARYAPSGKCLLTDRCWYDFSLTYVQPRDATLVNRNNGSTATYGLLNGSYASRVLIIGLQATLAF